jgi:CRISPR system Cascade subunit CasE
MAFPDDPPPAEDADEGGDVHEQRTACTGFLFRVDFGVDTTCRHSPVEQPAHAESPSNRSPVILVQSAKRPDWDHAFGLNAAERDRRTGKPFGNAGHLLSAPPQVKPFEPSFKEGERFRFRLTANPTRRVANGPFAGNRVSVGRDPAAILGWLARREASGGFRVDFKKDEDAWDSRWRVTTAMVRAWKGADEDSEKATMSFASAMIDGVLKVTNPAAFLKTLQAGIGSGKAFGFGLLSVAPV